MSEGRDIEHEIDDLIRIYPNRWEQAKANPKLLGWFVGKITAQKPATMIERTEIRRALKKRAAQVT